MKRKEKKNFLSLSCLFFYTFSSFTFVSSLCHRLLRLLPDLGMVGCFSGGVPFLRRLLWGFRDSVWTSLFSGSLDCSSLVHYSVPDILWLWFEFSFEPWLFCGSIVCIVWCLPESLHGRWRPRRVSLPQTVLWSQSPRVQWMCLLHPKKDIYSAFMELRSPEIHLPLPPKCCWPGLPVMVLRKRLQLTFNCNSRRGW